jgi:hypothetical protein
MVDLKNLMDTFSLHVNLEITKKVKEVEEATEIVD